MLRDAALSAVMQRLGIPFTRTLQTMAGHYGVKSSRFYDWDIVEITDMPPIVPAQVIPLSINYKTNYDLLPPDFYSCLIGSHQDPRENHKITLEQLRDILGEAVESHTSNTIGHIWEYEDGDIRLTTWPERDAQSCNPAHDKHPEIDTYCHLSFSWNFRPPPMAGERVWIESLRPFMQQGAAYPNSRGSRGIGRRMVEDAGPASVGVSEDGEALVGREAKDAWVIPRSYIVATELIKLEPARGPGGSSIKMEYTNIYSSEGGTMSQYIFKGEAPDSLDALAEEISSWAGTSLEITEDDDC